MQVTRVYANYYDYWKIENNVRMPVQKQSIQNLLTFPNSSSNRAVLEQFPLSYFCLQGGW